MKRGPYTACWESVLAEADTPHLRAATRLAMAGAVRARARDGGGFRAVVERSGTRRAFDVWVPQLADYAGHARQVAHWLAMRPDWLAAHYAGEWDESFLAFLAAHQVEVVPTRESIVRLRALSTCTCEETDPLCPHVLALLLQLIWEAEARPLAAFQLVGIEEAHLLDLVQQETASLARAARGSWEDGAPSSGGAREAEHVALDVEGQMGAWRPEEWSKDGGVRPLGRIRPVMHTEIRP
ncbi:hypothetical protein [Alicyclobacillus vulcanalis]|uniref:SWIM-type domain-containing protein n=1 Tax=Alicyclobacillus vulcanalis TaxID=252246 RepID=A0A1N7LY62_9BACL|nr:hypothetical protein [Alicyclobacillus vulcanalis]SIS78770.1 hypothetical protein SAMN05421799_10470 [Alicyclobacillus vulcanalis]